MRPLKLLTLVILIGFAVGALTANSGNASTLSEADDTIFGLGSITLDSATGLEWLDLTLSADRSFDDVSTQFGALGFFAGWRYAFTEEVVLLFENAGIRNGPIGSTGKNTLCSLCALDPRVDAFTALLGRSRDDADTRKAQGRYEDNLLDQGIAYAETVKDVRNGFSNLSDIQLGGAGRGATSIGDPLGSFLVRTSALTVVPLPASLPLFLTGLAGLGLMRRRKRLVLRD